MEQRAQLAMKRHALEKQNAEADTIDRLQAQLDLVTSQPALDAVNARLAAIESDVLTAGAKIVRSRQALTTKFNSLSHQMRRQLAFSLIEEIISMRVEQEETRRRQVS